jgi:GTP 3',8-cyclase
MPVSMRYGFINRVLCCVGAGSKGERYSCRTLVDACSAAANVKIANEQCAIRALCRDVLVKTFPLTLAASGGITKPLSLLALDAIKRAGFVADVRQRRLHDLRISVTDKCNFRCTYCMPKDVFGPGYKFLPHDALLSFEEITRFAKIAAELGVEKLRLTGGEPTLRRNLPTLIEMLSQLRTPSGKALDLTLTTNGSTLVKQARALKDAGLQRITVSLDSMDDAVFRAMNDVGFPVTDVLRGIDAALAAGLAPVKVNMVVKRGVNEHTVVQMAQHFKGTGVVVRFIEFMDVGATNGWRMDDVMPSRDVVAAIHASNPLVAVDPHYQGEVAERWRYACQPTAKSTPACLPITALTSERSCATAPATMPLLRCSQDCGKHAATATAKSALLTPANCARWR